MLWVRSAAGAEFQGSLDGVCSSPGVRFKAATPNAVAFSSGSGELVVYETWTNDSWLAPGAGPGGWVPLTANQVRHYHTVPSGPLRIEWNATGMGILTAHDAPLSIQLGPKGLYARTGPVDRAVPTAFERPLYDPRVGVVASPEAIPGPARLVQTTQPSYEGAGDVRFFFHSARVEAGDLNFVLPPYKQVRERVFLPLVAAYEDRLFTHAELVLREARFTLDAAAAEVACDGLAVNLTGGAMYHDAYGAIQRGSERYDFSQRELAVSGKFHLHEALEQKPGDGEQYWTLSTGTGRFDAAGIDFALLRTEPSGLGLFAPVGVATAALAVIAVLWSQFGRLVGFFYSRLDEAAALRHPTRSLLIQQAHQRPGVILKELVAATGRPYGVVRHHARVLERLHLVRTLRRGSALHLFPAGASIPAARRRLLLETDASVRYAVELAADTPKTFRELAVQIRARFGFSRMGSWKVLRRAERAGLLQRLERPEGVVAAASEPK